MFVAVLFTVAKTWKQPMHPLTNEWRKCGVCIYIYGILFSHKKEGNLAIFDNMDRPWGHYAKWNKSDRERQTPYK